MIGVGSRVMMTDKLKADLIHNDCQDHVDEFGECVGIVFDVNEYGDADLRWQPSNLRYSYAKGELVEVT